MYTTKGDWRKHYLNKRRNLTNTEWEYKNEQLLGHFISLMKELSPKVIHIFLPILKNKEPNTDLFRTILAKEDDSIQFVVPKMLPNSHEMKHYLLTSSTVLQTNKWGIKEPLESSTTEILPEQIDTVITPLLAFDREGYRLGYGGGYYDRFFTQCRKDVQKVGVSLFEVTEVCLPHDTFDISLDFCVTPHNIWRFN